MLLHGPVGRLVEHGRAGEAGAVHVGEHGGNVHHLAFFEAAEDLFALFGQVALDEGFVADDGVFDLLVVCFFGFTKSHNRFY